MTTTQPTSLDHLNAPDRADIQELTSRIYAYQRGQEDEDRFKHYRLTRGVYGQRQIGVHMFRTKIPFGHLTPDQLIALADISERFTNGRLHITTRQNIQLHYVKLNDSPAIWQALSEAGMTAREACGNTVRNLTASPLAGVDPDEPFDVSPYVYAAFAYFLRNPICQEMGRKIKPAFSSSEKDSAFTYFHDFGFIPRIRNGEKGFKVVLGGGLGAVAMIAPTAYEFLPADKIIPFMEATLRVFDRYGEREKRMKARLKYLLADLGLERLLELVEAEMAAVAHQTYPIDESIVPRLGQVPADNFPPAEPLHPGLYAEWLKTNVLEQKQGGYRAVAIRVPLGNLEAEQTRLLAGLIKEFASDDVRLSVQQGLVLRYVPPTALPHLFNGLYALNLGLPGYDTTADITACPGTDTCALGVTNSTGLAQELEALVRDEFPELVTENDIRIKISGCMNGCGQHMAANIGFHGSSIRVGQRIAPAMQVVVGGGVAPDGRGFVAEKIIKVPTRRIPQVVRDLFADYQTHANDGEYYNDYALRQGKRYFYDLLKPLGDTTEITDEEFFDWGQDHDYRQEIGVGECAGVSLDVVGAILNDASNKVIAAGRSVEGEAWADAVYHAYSAFITAAKALLLAEDLKCNTHIGILNDFAAHFGDRFPEAMPFPDLVLRINKQPATPEFATEYLAAARAFVSKTIQTREAQLSKVVIGEYYKA
ncbi:nitrite/sulfite reductase [Neolewinella lacunae]|uniref:Nitrite/sulfite reductase n=1 Tax=Neolewinella lacunae TaxID=1517758 RepID=A0A923PIS7_9BACT|nr:nitrite/sulfite reductase [Neolewinella lacunae]MBC6994847.1 nitrite/sulfite reductase [Neolewinella lacunae]MDN3636767.1 nitrite/sulfite reductase [Neolewinella lacunae]